MRITNLISAVAVVPIFLCLAVLPQAASAQPICTTTFLTLDGVDADSDPKVVFQGDAVAIASRTETGASPCTGTAVTEGTVKVLAKGLQNDLVTPVDYFTCADAGTGNTTTIYDGTTPTPGGTLFDTSGWPVTTVGIRADYNKATGSGATNYSQSNACVDLQILEVPVTGCSCDGLDPDIYVFADSASALGTAPGEVFVGSFDIRVKNCLGVAVDSVKVQGGAAGWLIAGVDTNFGDWANVDKNAIPGKNPKKNDKGADSFTWITNLAEEGDDQCKAIRINETGIVANKEPAGTVKFMSGPWSAAWDGMKSEYTGRVSFTVEEAP